MILYGDNNLMASNVSSQGVNYNNPTLANQMYRQFGGNDIIASLGWGDGLGSASSYVTPQQSIAYGGSSGIPFSSTQIPTSGSTNSSNTNLLNTVQGANNFWMGLGNESFLPSFLQGSSPGGGMMGNLGSLFAPSSTAGAGTGAGASGGLGGTGMSAMMSNPYTAIGAAIIGTGLASADPETFGNIPAVGPMGEGFNALFTDGDFSEFFDTDNLAEMLGFGPMSTLFGDDSTSFLSPISQGIGGLFGF